MHATAGATGAVLMLHESPGALGGSERALSLAAEGLNRRGWQVHLAFRQDDVVAGDGPYASATMLPLAAAQQVRAVRRLVEHHRIDVAHIHLWPTLATIAALARRLPVVATAHVPVCPNGARFLFGPERMCNRSVGAGCLSKGWLRDGCGHTADRVPFGAAAMVRSILRTRRELSVLRRCDRVIAPSRWQRERLITDGLPAERVQVVAEPIGTGVLRYRAPGPRQGRPLVIMAARLVRFKGAHHLLGAAARSEVGFDTVIAGDGPELPRLRGLSEELGITDRVRFAGRLNERALQVEIERADAMVVPSLWGETFGMTGPEAMVHGVPVVAYGQAGIDDWLVDGRNGLRVAPGDIGGLAHALDLVCSDAGLASRLRSQAAATVDAFTHDEHARRLDAVYHCVLNARTGTS